MAISATSTMAAMIKPLLWRDPTGEVAQMARSMLPAGAPRSEGGVWVSRQLPRAVLVANAARAAARHALSPPRPPHWGGYRLKPERWDPPKPVSKGPDIKAIKAEIKQNGDKFAAVGRQHDDRVITAAMATAPRTSITSGW